MKISDIELLEISEELLKADKDQMAYVLSLAAAEGLDGENRAKAFVVAGVATVYLNDLRKSEELLKKAIEADPNNSLAHYNYAILLAEMDRKVEAEEEYKKAIEADPNNSLAHNNYANLLAEMDRKVEAEEEYKKAIEANPNNSLAHNNYANLLREIGRFSEAENEVLTALRMKPSSPHALGTYGDILADEGYLEEAEEKYKEALKHAESMDDSAKSEIHNNLGWVYVQRKLYSNAKDEFQKAHFLDRSNVKAIRNLRALNRITPDTELTRVQWVLAGTMVPLLGISYYLFLINKINETTFTTQLVLLVAALIFVLLYKSISRFKAGPSGVEFEMSTERSYQFAPYQQIDYMARIER